MLDILTDEVMAIIDEAVEYAYPWSECDLMGNDYFKRSLVMRNVAMALLEGKDILIAKPDGSKRFSAKGVIDYDIRIIDAERHLGGPTNYLKCPIKQYIIDDII